MVRRDPAVPLVWSECVYICRFDPLIISICGQVWQQHLPGGGLRVKMTLVYNAGFLTSDYIYIIYV